MQRIILFLLFSLMVSVAAVADDRPLDGRPGLKDTIERLRGDIEKHKVTQQP